MSSKLYVAVILIISSIMLQGCLEYKEAEMYGTVASTFRDGLFYNTYHTVIILGGLEDATGSFGSRHIFTITDKSVYDKLKHLSNKKVKIHYHDEQITLFKRGVMESEGFINDVQEI